MKPVSLTADFIHADFSAVFYECSIPPLFSSHMIKWHSMQIQFYFSSKEIMEPIFSITLGTELRKQC